MVTRIWHGTTTESHAEKYLTFLRYAGTKDYLQCPGNLSVIILHQEESDIHHFMTITEWKDIDAVKNFAGEDYSKAVYYPEDEGFLLTKEERVKHYQTEVIASGRLKEFIRQLKELFDGGSWQGESFKEKLKRVDEVNAFLQPIPGVHSIAEIIWHCIYWRMTLLKSGNGELGYRDSTFEKLNFLSVEQLRSQGWEKLHAALLASQEQLISMLTIKSESFLEEHYEKDKTFSHLVEGIIQHDIYHLGQIGLVQKILALKSIK